MGDCPMLLLLQSTIILPIPILSIILAREKLSPTPWDKLLLARLLVEKLLPLTLDMELDPGLPRPPLTLSTLPIQLSTLVLPTLTTVTHLEEFTMDKLRIS